MKRMPADSYGFPINKGPQGHKSPVNWPQHLRYLASSVHHTSVPVVLRTHIGTASHANKDSSSKNTKRSKVVIRSISNDSHPANGQFGLFAAQRIPPKTHIVDYIGNKKKCSVTAEH